MKIINKNTVILGDFDGTIIENDGCDILMENHSVPDWEEPGRNYLKKLISHAEMNDSFAKMLSANEAQLIKTIQKKIVIRKGFKKFVNLAKMNGVTLIVISAGWELYIINTLKFLNFKYIENNKMLLNHLRTNFSQIPLITNKIVTVGSTNQWRIESPWLEQACQLSTPCKGSIASFLKKNNYNVIVIGNSETDACMIDYADLTFATGSLIKYLKNSQKKFISFSIFDEISNILFKEGQN